ncbi:MAG: hypothetical protein U1A27_14195 [Phycisphaerae bacterium]
MSRVAGGAAREGLAARRPVRGVLLLVLGLPLFVAAVCLVLAHTSSESHRDFAHAMWTVGGGRAGAVAGQVFAPDGRPLAGVAVGLLTEGGWTEATSDADGRFTAAAAGHTLEAIRLGPPADDRLVMSRPLARWFRSPSLDGGMQLRIAVAKPAGIVPANKP